MSKQLSGDQWAALCEQQLERALGGDQAAAMWCIKAAPQFDSGRLLTLLQKMEGDFCLLQDWNRLRYELDTGRIEWDSEECQRRAKPIMQALQGQFGTPEKRKQFVEDMDADERKDFKVSVLYLLEDRAAEDYGFALFDQPEAEVLKFAEAFGAGDERTMRRIAKRALATGQKQGSHGS